MSHSELFVGFGYKHAVFVYLFLQGLPQPKENIKEP